MNDHITIENEELVSERERAQTTRDPTKEFVTCSEGQAIIAVGLENLVSHCSAAVLSRVEDYILIDVLQVGYDVVEKELKTLLIIW